jgi:hypothetical protein
LHENDTEASLVIAGITVAVATKVRDKGKPGGWPERGRQRLAFDISPET